jgi:RHS repeat-associated protein
MGRILDERRTIGTVKGDYVNDAFNLDGSVASLTSLGGYGVLYTYSGAARPLTATHSTTQLVSGATYAPPGELAGMTMGAASGFAGIAVSDAYNDRLQPILLSAASPSGTVFSECFDFHLGVAVTGPAPCSFSANTTGDNGNVYQIVNNRDNTRNQNFNYDSLNRIQQAYSSGTQWGETFAPTATGPGVAPATSGIDPWGNLTNREGVTGKTNYEPLSVSAGTNNQLSSFGYDAAGNMTSNGSASYIYDDENRLIATAGYSYLYDGDGQRVEKCTEGTTPGTCATSATGTLYWRGSESSPLTETDLSGNVQNTYVFFNGQRVARSDSAGAIHYYFSDHLGSHGVVENATGSACEQDVDYYPYGGEENDYCTTPVSQNYKFNGKERDAESGLDYFGKRFHASSLGRFMSVDPHDFVVSDARNPKKFRSDLLDPQGWNRYAYVTNNPLKFADWEGLEKYLVVYVQQPVPGTSKTYDIQSYGHVVTGHSFIGLKDTTAHTETKAGFYPKDTVTPVSPTTTGELKDDSNHSWNVKQEYKITDDQYNAVQQSISTDKGDTNLQYDLNTNNCTDWVMDTAGKAGITLPDATGTWPDGGGQSPGPLGQELKQQPGATVQEPKKDQGSSGSDDSSGSS